MNEQNRNIGLQDQVSTEGLSEQELAAWLKLCLIPGLGGESQRKLMQAFGLPEQVLAMGYTAWRSVIGVRADLLRDAEVDASVEQALAWAGKPGQAILPLHDPRYPRALLEIPDPPSLLYVRGKHSQLDKPGVAIVGSRHASTQGQQTARAMAQALSEAGYGIVSGLALGIDAAAHEGGLLAQGKTLAVIGTGADRLYPARNSQLAEQIVAEGLLVSELPLGTPALAGNFPRRNRIIAGLSRGVLIVEAALESGSLITARLASEQGRDVMAIPGSIHSPLTKGCHRLIREGAKLVETVDDVLEEIGYLKTPARAVHKSTGKPPSSERPEQPRQAAVLDCIGHEGSAFDDIVALTGLPTSQVLASLLDLEMDRWIASLPGDRYQRIR